MTESELERKLNSVGKSCFVKYYNLFKSYAEHNITKLECINALVVNLVSNCNGAAIRCSNAKKIFEKNMQKKALNIILTSNRIDNEIKEIANNILENSSFKEAV